jgi:hypothetical protein
MQQTNFLADTFEPESFIFQKPKKYKNAELMASRIKNMHSEQLIVQFPKMNVINYDKMLELEFTSETGYNKKVKKFLSGLDQFIVDHISTQSEKWFGKTIPIENVKNMYKPCVNENKVKFIFNENTELINKREERVDTSEMVKGVIVESICLLKYLIFTKDSCFLHWEICTAKVHKKIQRVPLFGFIEDSDDQSDNEELTDENITFW